MTVADSTVGLAIWNALALLGPSPLGAAREYCAREFGFQAPSQQWARAAAELARRGRLGSDGGVLAPKFRGVVRTRSRAGDGWSGWVVDTPAGRVLLDEVTR